MANKQFNSQNMHKGAARTQMMEQGGYDGRFMNKTFKDKKKHENRQEARKFKQNWRAFA